MDAEAGLEEDLPGQRIGRRGDHHLARAEAPAQNGGRRLERGRRSGGDKHVLAADRRSPAAAAALVGHHSAPSHLVSGRAVVVVEEGFVVDGRGPHVEQVGRWGKQVDPRGEVDDPGPTARHPELLGHVVVDDVDGQHEVPGCIPMDRGAHAVPPFRPNDRRSRPAATRDRPR